MPSIYFYCKEEKAILQESEMTQEIKKELDRLKEMEQDLRDQESILRDQEKLQEEMQEALAQRQKSHPTILYTPF